VPLFVVSDVHGHREALREALREAGLTGADGRWAGQDAQLWLLGDYVDRGPDGIGVVDDIRRLTGEARATGGEVGALLGNHEVQLLAAHRFGHAPVAGWGRPGGFRELWARYGGQAGDLRRLTPEHLAWITALPAMALVDGHLLMHSDTTRYLEFGRSVEAVNAAVAEALRGTDVDEWWEFVRRISGRGTFRADGGEDEAAVMLGVLGGEVIAHGHSTLIQHFGVAAGDVREAVRYAGGRVVAVDGGVFEGGRLLLTRLR
jgi:hypothetical protein